MELFSGELTRAGSGGDFAPSPPNTSEAFQPRLLIGGPAQTPRTALSNARRGGGGGGGGMEKEAAGGCGVVGDWGFPGRFQERVYTVIPPSLHSAYHPLLRTGFPYGGIPYV
ncbi:hypothetical protein EYF80_013620 [Liparis tanakae]|uniref:Uncharacterized protein n=1 Tax=Liparis tanakae TaxID=230148 RepID=A0A4Z2IDC5_9TELE|nr:hypothetical protein EYF80_013620 [Liparis tanakae]